MRVDEPYCSLFKPLDYLDYFEIREYNALVAIEVRNLFEFLLCDLKKVLDLRGFGQVTYDGLYEKQEFLRQRIYPLLSPSVSEEAKRMFKYLGFSKYVKQISRLQDIVDTNDEASSNILKQIETFLFALDQYTIDNSQVYNISKTALEITMELERFKSRFNKYSIDSSQSDNEEENISACIDYSNFGRIVRSYISSVLGNDRDTDILMRRLFDGASLEEIGKIYGLTRERIRQIVLRDTCRLKHHRTLQRLNRFWVVLKDIIDNYKGKIEINRLAKVLEFYFNWHEFTEPILLERLISLNYDFFIDSDGKTIQIRNI